MRRLARLVVGMGTLTTVPLVCSRQQPASASVPESASTLASSSASPEADASTTKLPADKLREICSTLHAERKRIWIKAQSATSIEDVDRLAETYTTAVQGAESGGSFHYEECEKLDVTLGLTSGRSEQLALQIDWSVRALLDVRVGLMRVSDQKTIDTLLERGKILIDTLARAAGARAALIGKNLGFECSSDSENQTFDHAETKESIDRNYCRGVELWRSIQTEVRLRTSDNLGLCGALRADGLRREWCAAYGVIGLNLSLLWSIKGPSGFTRGRVVSAATPYIGVRWIPIRRASFLAVEAIAFSQYFLASDLDASQQQSPCGAEGNAFEKTLPCEVKPKVRPYIASHIGITLGRENFGFLSVGLLGLGVAEYGGRGLFWYYSLTVSSLQITGRF